MKIIFLLSLSLSLFAHSFNTKINLSNGFLDSLITPLWDTIPYQYNFTNKQFFGSSDVSYSIEKGLLVLAPDRFPLFNLELLDLNKVGLSWNLNQAKADVLVKIRFKFKQYGIQITHDEYFNVKLLGIKSAYSLLEIKDGDQLTLNHLESKNFVFESITVTERDGIGSTLRYILDNIFSKREIDNLIRMGMNDYLKDWVNDSQIIKSAQRKLNQDINNNLKTKRRLPNLASTISFDLNQITLSKSELSLKLTPIFHSDYNTHVCASDIAQKSNIQISHSILEKVLNNLTLNEVITPLGIKEPLLCLGYKDNQDGEDVAFNFMGRMIKFKLWIRPSEKIKVFYRAQRISVQLNLTSIIKTTTYPHIYLVGDRLKIKSTLNFSIKMTTKGIVTNLDEFKVNSITGRAHVKWSRFIPKVRLPLKIIASSIEKEMGKRLKDELQDFVLLEKVIQINPQYNVHLETYSNEESFDIGFSIR